MMSSRTPTDTRTTLPRDTATALADLALAVQKRAIYPPDHPVLRGAVERVHERLANLVADGGSLAIGVAERRLIIDGIATDEGHPHHSELASRLIAHQIGGLRLQPGVSAAEVSALVNGLATLPDGPVTPLALREDLLLPHIALRGLAFDRLGLLDGQGSAAQDPGEVAWRALATVALGDGVGEWRDPAAIAAAIRRDDGVTDEIIEQLAALFTTVSNGQASTRTVEQVAGLLEALGGAGIERLLDLAGPQRHATFVGASSRLPSLVAVDLVQAASRANAQPISAALFRLLRKFASDPGAGSPISGHHERLLRLTLRRLLDGWTLENPNPERYETALANVAVPQNRGRDERRDAVEPERVIDLALETGAVHRAAESALGRLVMRDGLGAALDFLSAYPPSDTREVLLDRVLNESTLREYLSQDSLNVPLLKMAIDRMQGAATPAVLEALARRDDEDAGALVELLTRIGWDVLEPMAARMPAASPRVLRHYVAVFDAVEAWPPGIEPMSYATHPDFLVRREALKHLLRASETREAAILAALRDRDVRLVAIGLAAIGPRCSLEAARLVMRRFDDGVLTNELRVRAIRIAATCPVSEVLQWLVPMVRMRRWWLWGAALRKPTAERVAAVAALTAFPAAPEAQRVLTLARRHRATEYRRAAARVVEERVHA